jgi:hypothetical protein
MSFWEKLNTINEASEYTYNNFLLDTSNINIELYKSINSMAKAINECALSGGPMTETVNGEKIKYDKKIDESFTKVRNSLESYSYNIYNMYKVYAGTKLKTIKRKTKFINGANISEGKMKTYSKLFVSDPTWVCPTKDLPMKDGSIDKDKLKLIYQDKILGTYGEVSFENNHVYSSKQYLV